MYIKKLLILLNLVLVCLLKGQSAENKRETYTSLIDDLKTDVYKSIILSKEFKSTKKCHIVGINSVSLNMKYIVGSAMGNYFYDIKPTKDSISVKELRKELPKEYWIFEDTSNYLGVEYNKNYIDILEKSDSLYASQNFAYDYDICKNSVDIIKIYEPLDKWMKFYEKHYSRDYRYLDVIIPVKYESLSKGLMFLEKEKYYLFKIKIGYDDKRGLEVVKEIMK